MPNDSTFHLLLDVQKDDHSLKQNGSVLDGIDKPAVLLWTRKSLDFLFFCWITRDIY